MEVTNGGEGAHELLQAQAHVFTHTFNFVSSMALKCAVELGVPDIIHNHGRRMTLSKLTDALPVTPSKIAHVKRLMRLLVHLSFFALQKNEDGEEGYVLTPSSRLLLNESRTGLSPLLLMQLDPVMFSPWNVISKWFQGKEALVMETATDMGLWEYVAKNPEAMFNGAMASDSRIILEVLVKECGWAFQRVGSIVDVGGGTVDSAMTIAKAFSHIECTVLDLPHVVRDVPKTTDRDFVGGDMFQSIPIADAVFIKWILHDWSDENCVKILAKCKESIPSKEEGGGKERDEQEWRKIFMDAGFNQYKMAPVLGSRSVIELYP
ncbi:hypothetical protein MRB53_019415 [Persea americana]|uniref:Uncharacterized protein n=1 Tax=Persea americana TaxID=3435 RepID=A0ACC2KYQ3_PERAE|nr:hypothetical protein MRB53_019415 [Persea americana]